jgi:transposase
MRFDLTDEEWELLEPSVPVARNDRRVLDGIFYVLRTGVPWRDLPERYGPYTTVYNRFNRWSRRGVFKRMFEALAAKSRDSLHLIDSTIVKAHRAAAGAKGGRKIKRLASAAAGGARRSTPTLTARCGR